MNDSAEVVDPPKALPERARSPFFKRSKVQLKPCAPDNPSIVSYMHKWQVADYPVSMMMMMMYLI